MADAGRYPPEDGADEAFVFELLQRFAADMVAGGLRPLADYLAQYPPERAATVAREHEALQADCPEDPVAGAWPRLPQRIQRFVVERELGRGGQAVVYLAQDPKLHRRVALKVLERGFATVEQELRLEREAATAARLDDPGICAVHEVGRDGDHVFVVMRHVPGRTLASHLDEARRQVAEGKVSVAEAMPWQQVVECFARAAQSLARAHAAGVVHRDLKPGNVMIEPDGAPVLLDFGLAAPTERDSDLMTLSRTGDLSGTPSYLPPERLLGRGGRDTSGDLWSLGVSLYEALTLQRPFTAPTVAALYQQILVAEPAPLRRLRPDVPSDLDVVLRVVLDKEPERRYRSAEALAADLRAVLAREPIAARPPGPWRRFTMVHRRHPALATLVWVTLSALGGLLWVQGRALQEIAAARDEATGINDFLVEKLLLAVRPERAQGREVTAAEVFDQAMASVDASFPRPTATAARVHHLLGLANFGLSRYRLAQRCFERASAMRTDLLGAEHADTLDSRYRLCRALRELDEHAAAEAMLREVVAAQERTLGAEAAPVLVSRMELTSLLLDLGRAADAERNAASVATIRERRFGPDTLDTWRARHGHAKCLEALGRRQEAEAIMRDVVSRSEAVVGRDGFELHEFLNDFASLLHDRAVVDGVEAAWDEAAGFYERAMALVVRTHGKEHHAYALALNNAASFEQDRGMRRRDAAAMERAEVMFRESLAVREQLDGEETTRVATACNNLAVLYTLRNRHEEAEPLLRRGATIRARLLGEKHPEVLKDRTNLLVTVHNVHGGAQSLPMARELDALAGAVELRPDLHVFVRTAVLFVRGESGEREHAMPAAEALYETHVRELGAASHPMRQIAQMLARWHKEAGRTEAADQWRRRSKGQ